MPTENKLNRDIYSLYIILTLVSAGSLPVHGFMRDNNVLWYALYTYFYGQLVTIICTCLLRTCATKVIQTECVEVVAIDSYITM